MSDALQRFVAAAPRRQRAGMRIALALARRPRSARLLRRLGPLDQAIGGMLAMEHFDEPAASLALGWDADAIAARGRALRRVEGRP